MSRRSYTKNEMKITEKKGKKSIKLENKNCVELGHESSFRERERERKREGKRAKRADPKISVDKM